MQVGGGQEDEGIQLHHVGQDFFGPLDEISAAYHSQLHDDTSVHPYAGDPLYDSWRRSFVWHRGAFKKLGAIFNAFRQRYWRRRFK